MDNFNVDIDIKIIMFTYTDDFFQFSVATDLFVQRNLRWIGVKTSIYNMQIIRVYFFACCFVTFCS